MSAEATLTDKVLGGESLTQPSKGTERTTTAPKRKLYRFGYRIHIKQEGEREQMARLLLLKGNTADGVRGVINKHFFCCPGLASSLLLIVPIMEEIEALKARESD